MRYPRTNNISPQPAGVTVRGYDYKKYEAGAVHYMPPFRFPGQYFDEETGFHENWNRYYEPLTGRYLSPEPLLQDPNWVAWELQNGFQVPAYSYARNNPVAYTDPNGLNPGAGAAAGASVGSAAGPVGAAVGATVGAVAGTAAAAAVASAVSNAPPINWAGTEPGAGVPDLPRTAAPPIAVCADAAPTQPSRSECQRRKLDFVLTCIRWNCGIGPGASTAPGRSECVRVCQGEGEMIYRQCLGPGRGGF